MTAMHESYFHKADPNGGPGIVRTNRLRSVERTTDDGRKIRASKLADDGINLQLETRAGTRVEDVLNSDERVGLAKLLLSDLPLDQVREALPAELFTSEWALRQNDSNGNGTIINDPTPSPDPMRYAQRVLANDGMHTHLVRREVTDWIEVAE